MTEVLASGPRGYAIVGAALLSVVLPLGCLEAMPTFGAACASHEDCDALGVCFDGACVPRDFPGLELGDDDGGPTLDAGGDDDAGPLDAGFDAGPLDAGFDAGPIDAGDDDAGVSEDAGANDAGDDDAGPLDAGFDAGPQPVCGDNVVEGDEQCDWGDGRNGVGETPCTGACTFDLSSPRRVNLDPLGGQQSGQVSGYAQISADGRHVAYMSDSLDVSNAATEGRDPIVRVVLLDLTTGSTVIVNEGANASASNPSLSADGDVVVFDSTATNLGADTDTNGTSDVYAYRRSTGELLLVSKSPTTNAAANGASFRGRVDASGQTVVFMSNATDLVAGTPSRFEVFRADLDAPADIVHVSTNETGGLLNEHSENPVISGDGSTVAFYMYASDFFGTDNNGSPDTVFIDEQRGYASRPPAGGEADGASYVESISHDGGLIALRTTAANLSGGSFQQSVLFEKATGQIHRIAWSAGQAPNAVSTGAFVSGDGRYVAFNSGATNLVTDDSSVIDVYVRRVEGFSTSGLPTRVTAYNDGAGVPVMPYDGAVILFTSKASNIVPNDTNGYHDIFLVRNPLYP